MAKSQESFMFTVGKLGTLPRSFTRATRSQKLCRCRDGCKCPSDEFTSHSHDEDRHRSCSEKGRTSLSSRRCCCHPARPRAPLSTSPSYRITPRRRSETRSSGTCRAISWRGLVHGPRRTPNSRCARHVPGSLTVVANKACRSCGMLRRRPLRLNGPRLSLRLRS